jgi:hypothetical protein
LSSETKYERGASLSEEGSTTLAIHAPLEASHLLNICHLTTLNMA